MAAYSTVHAVPSAPFSPVILKNDEGTVELHVLPYGLTLHRLIVRTEGGKEQDLLVGPEEPERCGSDGRLFRNTVVGRYANRLRVSAAAQHGVRLEGDEGSDVSLHGGSHGFDTRTWEHVSDPIKMQVVHAIGRPTNEKWAFFALNSADGDQGYPGNLLIEARVVLRTKPGMIAEVELDFAAMHDYGWQGPPTPLNLTWHLGWNLSDFTPRPGEGTILDHQLCIKASRVLELDADGVPTGRLLDVERTPLDYRTARTLRQWLPEKGLDHNLVFDPFELEPTRLEPYTQTSLDPVVTLSHPSSPVWLAFTTSYRSVQIYTAEGFDPARPTSRKNLHRANDQGGYGYGPRDALFLEFQAPCATFQHPQLIEANGGATTMHAPGDKLYETAVKIEIRSFV